jgi:hypothetical protein
MKRVKYFALFLCMNFILISLSLNVMAEDLKPAQLPMHGTIAYDQSQTVDLNIKRQFYSGVLKLTPATYVDICDMWVGHYNRLFEVPQIHAINPNQICLLYRNIRDLWCPGHAEYLPSEYDLFLANGWVLKDAYANYIRFSDGNRYMIDVGNKAYHTWLADWFVNYLDEYGADGVYLDLCLPHWEIALGATSTPINPRTGSSWTSQEYNDALIDLVDAVKAKINPKIVVGNTLYTGYKFYREDLHQYLVNFILNSRIDGVMDEGWVSRYSLAEWYTEEDWIKSIDEAVWINSNFLSKGSKIFWTTSENAGIHFPTNAVALPLGVTKEQYVLFCYASQLLAATNDGNYMNFGTYILENYPQSLFQIALGSPKGTYYKIAGTHVYSRDFSEGKVLVNPTSTEYTVMLGGSFQTPDGSIVTSITVVEHSGLILRNS